MKSVIYKKSLKAKYPKKRILRKILLSFLLSSSLINQTHSSVIFDNVDSEIEILSKKIISSTNTDNEILPSSTQNTNTIQSQETQVNEASEIIKEEKDSKELSEQEIYAKYAKINKEIRSIDKELSNNSNNNELIAKKEQLIQEKNNLDNNLKEINNEEDNTNFQEQTIRKAKVKAHRIISREKPNVKSKQVEIYRENRILDIENIITNETGTKWAKLANKEEYISAKWLEFDDKEVIKEHTHTNFKDKKIIKKPFETVYLENPTNANYYNENLKTQKALNDNKKDNNLSKEDQEFSNKVMKVIQTAGAIYDSEDSKSKEEIVKNMASSYLNTSANELAKEFIDSLNTSINTDFSFNYNERSGFSGNAKALLPIVSEDNPKISYFLQSGIGEFANDRTIGHFGGGIRYYPNATALNNSGNIMLGLNSVYDHDFSRGHKRMSLGAEAMVDTLAFNANVYQRLSSWIDSYDFDKDYVQERPANGWDAKIKYAFPSLINVSFFAKMGQWYGNKVGIFGANSVDDLEKNPLIYEGGISYSPFPALTFTLSHSRSAESSKKNTSINANINIPLDEKAMKLAFEPKLAGISNTIEGTRTQFIDRDYSMVLEYRATPNKYHISYCGDLGNDKHCILLKNGFDEVVKNTPMRVTPTHSCVVFEKGFDYITDNSGKVYVQIIRSCTPKTDLNAVAGEANGKFPISIIKLDFKIKADPEKIERFEESLITLAGGNLANNLKVVWRLIGKGELIKTNTSDTTDNNGEAIIKYKADDTMKDKEEVKVIASVNGVEFKAPVQIMVFGNNDNDLSIDKEVIGNKEIAIATYKNLRPNKTNVKWRLDGEDKALFVLENENKSSTAKELQLIADNKGESKVKIIGLGNNGKVKIFAKNINDESVSEKNKELEVKNYKATMILPTHKHPITNTPFENGTIDYVSEFEVKLTGLMPNTKVEWIAKDTQNNKTLRISNNKETTSNEKGESKVVFEAIKDYNVKNLEITAIYNQSLANKIEVKDNIKLYQYSLAMNSQKDKLDAYENGLATKNLVLDKTEVKVTGGKPNEKVEWDLTGDGTLSNQELSFDQNGEAKALLTSKTPFKTPIKIVTSGVGKNSNKVITYDLRTFTPTIEYPILKNIYGTFQKTIDYDIDYSIKVKGLLPDSEVEIVESPNVSAKQTKYQVNSSGEVTLTFNKINQTNVLNIAPKFNFIKTGDIKETFTMENIAIKQYPLTASASKEKIDAYINGKSKDLIRDFSIITVSGGKPNQVLTWSVSGHGALSEEQRTFNAQGKATAKLSSKAPYTTNPVVKAQSINKDSTKTISYQLRTFTPVITYPVFDSTLYGKHEKTIDYDTDYSILVKGLLPDSIIEPITNGVIKPKSNSVQVNNKGEATIAYHKISDFNTKKIKPQFKYIKSGDTKETFTMNDINLYQYKLSISSDKTELVGDEIFKVTVRGGKPNASVEWTLTGDGKITSKDSKFNAKGEAYLNGQGKSPFNNSINVEAKAFNQILKASAKISIYESRGILAHPTGNKNGGNGRTALLGNDNGEDGQAFGNYTNGYSIFTLVGHNGNFDLGIYGYKNIEDIRNANIKITYTPAYGGNKQWNLNYFISSKIYYLGNTYLPFDMNHYTYLLFSKEEASIPTKQNNGIYKFEDLNNKYIKPTYLHLKLP
ncbi:inverse autotransporter beta domain-containing protein [Campylobacter lari]|uniref:inverse autotransporter beta domain-containing protein n=2 Tax=Campylobacter lari TaxID=201 RepID=UPI0021F796E1|nr:inverse autotransporter beta domain-containing protein [Campylobacter lari]MCW0196397.1 inverse autotransporter beta domain-containing protein [Campylobacter lari]